MPRRSSCFHIGKCLFEDLAALECVSPFDGLAGARIPQLPRRAVHHCLGEERRDLVIPGEGCRNIAHGVGIASAPHVQVLGRFVGGVTMLQGIDERLLNLSCRILVSRCQPATSTGQSLDEFVGLEGFPWFVVVRADAIRQPPLGHGTCWISFKRLLEAHHRLFVVVAEDPVQSSVEPRLSIARPSRYRAAVNAQVVRILCHNSPLPAPR